MNIKSSPVLTVSFKIFYDEESVHREHIHIPYAINPVFANSRYNVFLLKIINDFLILYNLIIAIS